MRSRKRRMRNMRSRKRGMRNMRSRKRRMRNMRSGSYLVLSLSSSLEDSVPMEGIWKMLSRLATMTAFLDVDRPTVPTHLISCAAW